MILPFIGEQAVSRKLSSDNLDYLARIDLRPITFGGLRLGDAFRIVQTFKMRGFQLNPANTNQLPWLSRTGGSGQFDYIIVQVLRPSPRVVTPAS